MAANDRKSNWNWFKHPKKRGIYLIILKSPRVKHSSVSRKSRARIMLSGSDLPLFSLCIYWYITYDSIFLYILVTLIHTVHKKVKLFYWMSRLALILLWVNCNKHISPLVAPLNPCFNFIAFDWFHISLPEPTSPSKVECNALLARLETSAPHK